MVTAAVVEAARVDEGSVAYERGRAGREKSGYFRDDVPAEIVNLRVLGKLLN